MENTQNEPNPATLQKIICAYYIQELEKIAKKLCDNVREDERQNFLNEWDERGPDLSVSDIESGKADEWLEPINLSRALIVAAFNADREGKTKFQ